MANYTGNPAMSQRAIVQAADIVDQGLIRVLQDGWERARNNFRFS